MQKGRAILDHEHYLNIIKSRFNSSSFVNSLCAEMFYEENIEFLSKLKKYSFVSYSQKIGVQTIGMFTSNCIMYALRNYKGLPRGFQNGVLCFNVLASEHIAEKAVSFANERPQKHFAAFEIPVIMDLKNHKLCYYKDTPIWGAVYYKNIRKFI